MCKNYLAATMAARVFKDKLLRHQMAASSIQCCWRQFAARETVVMMRRATYIQQMKNLSIKLVNEENIEKESKIRNHAAIWIQKIWQGHRAKQIVERKRFNAERRRVRNLHRKRLQDAKKSLCEFTFYNPQC